MGYNKRILLEKIIAIQTIVVREQKRGVSQKWIYENLIASKFYISYPTFNNYLARNAKRELAELNETEIIVKAQFYGI